MKVNYKRTSEYKFNVAPSYFSNSERHATNDFFFTKIDSKFIRIDISELVYVKAESPGNYVRIVTDTKSVLQSLGLKSFMDQIHHKSLIRINRSYIININKIISFDKGRVFIQAGESKQEIPIGITYRERFQKLFLKLRAD